MPRNKHPITPPYAGPVYAIVDDFDELLEIDEDEQDRSGYPTCRLKFASAGVDAIALWADENEID